MYSFDAWLAVCRVLCGKLVGATSNERCLVTSPQGAAIFIVPAPPIKKAESGNNGRYRALHLQYSVDDGRERRVIGDVGDVKNVRTPHVQYLQTLSNEQDHTRLKPNSITLAGSELAPNGFEAC